MGADEDHVAKLESIAQQLVARVRDDDPEANLRWLRAELGIDPNAPVSDLERLLFVAAIAVPLTRWSELTAWARATTPEYIRLRREGIDMPRRRAA